MIARFTAVALVLVALAAPATVRAQTEAQTEVMHRVREGDSLQLLAAEYYGDRKYVIVVMSVNGITHERSLEKGERLKIPIPRPITAAPGDTWEALADQYLGDKRRGKFLAEFNDLLADSSLAAGQQLIIPYHMVYTASAETKLTSLAATFLFDRRKAKLLHDYNFLDRQSIDKAESLIIPIAVDVKPSKLPPLDADSSARRVKRAEEQQQAGKALKRAQDAWRTSEYAKVRQELAEIQTEYLDTDPAVEIDVLLGAAYVAAGDNETARSKFKRARARNPQFRLSAYRYSPKIRAVWKEAGGEVNEGTRQ